MDYRVVFLGSWASYRDEDARTERLLNDSVVLVNDWIFTVPKDFEHDFATKPLWKLGNWNEPAVFHDWLYTYRPMKPDGTRVSRKEADEIFYCAMLDKHVPKWRAWIMYKAVRVFGGIYWHKHDDEFAN